MKMTKREQELWSEFERAMTWRDMGDLAAARQLLESILERCQPLMRGLTLHSHLQLGYISKLLGDQAAREAHFCEAVAIAPKYDLASSGLFFALFAQDRLGDALRELVRYLRLKYSQLYAEMLIVGFEIGFSDEHAKLVDEARQLLAKYRRN